MDRTFQLQEAQQRLRLAIKSLFQISFEWDIKSDKVNRLESFDPVLASTSAQEPDTFESVRNVVHPDDRELFNANIASAMKHPEGHYTNEYRIVHPGGKVKCLSETGLIEYDDADRPLRLIGLSKDITERKKAEKIIMQSEERFRSLFENSLDAIFLTIPDGRVLDVNRAA